MFTKFSYDNNSRYFVTCSLHVKFPLELNAKRRSPPSRYKTKQKRKWCSEIKNKEESETRNTKTDTAAKRIWSHFQFSTWLVFNVYVAVCTFFRGWNNRFFFSLGVRTRDRPSTGAKNLARAIASFLYAYLFRTPVIFSAFVTTEKGCNLFSRCLFRCRKREPWGREETRNQGKG